MPTSTEKSTPHFRGSPFICPHCRQFSRQTWGQASHTGWQEGNACSHSFDVTADQVCFSKCDACDAIVIWKSDKVVWPHVSLAPEAHVDFPDNLRSDYEEARQIYNDSPRASAALLRLCLQKLCVHLGAPGENINNDIQYLYDEYGLGRRVRDSMDILRVVGNNAVHPGEIDLDDNREISLGLFRIINFIVDKAISEPAHVDSIFSQLPEGAREAIERRDQRAATNRPQLEQPTSK
jgi:Domain of unknown function (DUF4145)